MRIENVKLKSDLLQAAKEEFMSYGFQGAQLRLIAAKIGVTTGAVYKYFKDKEALFDALVKEPSEKILEFYSKAQDEYYNRPLENKIHDLPELNNDGQMWMVEFMYDNFDAFKLIVCHSTGTKYEHYLERLISIEVKSSISLINSMKEAGMKINDIPDELIHILATALFEGVVEPIRHNMTKEKAISYLERLTNFYTAGWTNLLGLNKSNKN